MVCSLTADTFIARYKKSLLVYFVPHQPPQLPDHPPLVEAQTFTVYLLLSDLAFLPLLYLRRPRSSLVPPHSVYRRPEPASLFITTFELHTLSAAEPVLSCCCQPPHLACVAVLLCLQAAPPVTHTPTQVCWMPWSLFYSQEVEPWVSSGLSCLTKGDRKKKDCMGLPGDMGGGGKSTWTFSSRQKRSASWLSEEGNSWGSSSVAAACPFESSSLQMEEMNQNFEFSASLAVSNFS